MSNVNKALAVLAALAFFLPFVTLSVSVANPFASNAKLGYSLSVTGAKAVQCYLTPCSAKDFLSSQGGVIGAIASRMPNTGVNETIKLSGSGVPDLGINFLLFAAIAVVVAVIALFLGRGGQLLSGLASIGVIVLLFLFRSKLGDAISPFLNSPEINAAGSLGQIQFQYGMGFWACAVLSGLSAVLAFKGNLGVRAPLTSASGSAGGYAPPPQAGAAPPSSESLSVCSACGSVNSAASKFCLSCGALISAPPVQAGSACPSCGSSNAGGGKFCLACGASMAAAPPQPAAVPPAQEKATPPEPQGLVCPSCGSGSPGTGKFCLACGASLAAPAVQPSQPAPEKTAAPEPQGPVCPSCGSSNAGGGKFCLACGASLAAPEKKAAAAPQGSVCPSCGADNPGTGKFCLACGGSLMAGVQLFERADASAPPPVSAPAPAVAPVASVPEAAMAAQASASAPAGQPLRAVAPSPAPEPVVEPPVAPVISAPIIDEPPKAPVQPAPPQAEEQQQSLDWTAPPSSAEPQQQACTSCGATLGAGQKFCLSCGTPVGQAGPAAKTEAPAFTPAPLPEPAPPMAATQIFEPAPKSSSKAWIIVVIAVAALGAGGYFGWQYFTRPDVTVTTNVQRIHVAAGGKTSLEANVSGSSNTDVDWSVQEGAKGGQVTTSGTVMSGGQLRSGALYTAPQGNGTYHVIATSRANSSRSAKIEIIVGGTALPDNTTGSTQPAPPTAPTTTGATSTSPSATPGPAAAYPNAAQIVGTWTGPTTDTRTTIGANSTISMSSPTNAQNNKSGTYRFTDNTHLDVDFGSGDVRKWEILGFQGAYLRVSEQANSGSSALIFQKVQ